MAKQIGSTFIGTVDGLSCYYNRLHGYLVRQTGGVTSKQYRKDRRYEAARDNSKEFCVVSGTGKLIREALGGFLLPVKDGTMVNRLNKELVALKQQDRTHFRGERRPDVMMTDENANIYFRIFQFNEGVKLYDLLEGYPASDEYVETGCIPSDLTVNNIRLKTSAFPEGATHAGLTLVRTVIDFETGTYRTVSSTMTVVPASKYVETECGCAMFTPAAMKSAAGYRALPALPNLSAAGTEIVCLQVLFFKEQNGDLVQVPGKVHSMGILSVKQVTVPAELPTSKYVETGCIPSNECPRPVRRGVGCFPSNDSRLPIGMSPDPTPRKRKLRRPRRDYKLVLRQRAVAGGEDGCVYVQVNPETGKEGDYFVFRNGKRYA